MKEKIRCAIYTRKSTSIGLERDFTTLDAQRESALNYIASQKLKGWVALDKCYDDGGYTGSNIQRPALAELLSDIDKGLVDCVVVYKVDRLSRSLLDFVQMLELFEKKNVAFISVTQHFNTEEPMGRLTLNILLSFAQFERELISERTRDKMGAARRKGRWVGGRPPFGYDLDKLNHKIVINPVEAEQVRRIFALYVQEKSLIAVARELNASGVKTKAFASSTGTFRGGGDYSVTYLQHMFHNFTYIGKVKYEDQVYDGQHDAIVDEELFYKVQELMGENRASRKVGKNTQNIGLLSKLLYCEHCQKSMFFTYTSHGKRKYSYYVCVNAQKRGYEACPSRSVSAGLFEAEFSKQLQAHVGRLAGSEERYSPLADYIKKEWDDLPTYRRKHLADKIVESVHYNGHDKRIKVKLNETGIEELCNNGAGEILF